MTNINQTESGERLSFYKLFSEKNYKIEIPIIQRDYAQGRDSNADVRDIFLDALKAYLLEEKPNRDLDFIYGSLLNVEDNKSVRFVPLDGQQRLTTLFLLHWYLANKEDKLANFREVFAEAAPDNKWKSKFTYETRTSAKEFCDALVSADITFKTGVKAKALSRIIKNQQWYFLSWKNDPTIQGMLVMLDALQANFNDDSTNFYQLLIDVEKPIITFQFLKLEEFGLTDDLYIKMNARGKPLSSFENFKAKFEQQIKKPKYNTKEYVLGSNSHKRKVNLHKYFSHKIDTAWANLFWAYAIEEIKKSKKDDKQKKIIPFDDIIMNLFKTFAINFSAGKKDADKIVRELIKTNSNELTFSQFKEHDCFNTTSVPKLIRLLDILQNDDKKAKQFIPGFYYFDENSIESFLKNEFKTAVYVERIMLHAYFEYLIRWNDEGDFTDFEGLKKWMRIIHNLTENTKPYNNEKEFTNSIKGINEVIDNSNDIHNYLIQRNSISGFDTMQVEEEILKANLIEKSNDWKDLIYKAEQHGYFKGQIGFLLELTEITVYFNEFYDCSWDKSQETIYKQNFAIYFDKANEIFNSDGLISKRSAKGSFIWERALLAVGSFLIKEGRNHSFLINFDRDISWKRFLKGDKDDAHNQIIKDVFDALDINGINRSLKKIIKSYTGNDWRKPFIDTPQLFDYLGPKRYVRYHSEHGFVLFKGERMSGSHSELYSLQFFINHLLETTIVPFSNCDYHSPSGADTGDMPCVYMSDWGNTDYELYIAFINGNFEIGLYNTESIKIQNKIVKVLEQNGMAYSDKYDIPAYIITIPNDLDTWNFINDLCFDLQTLKV